MPPTVNCTRSRQGLAEHQTCPRRDERIRGVHGDVLEAVRSGVEDGLRPDAADLVGPILNLKGNHDFGSSNLAQHILNHLMESGAYHRHVEKLHAVYRQKRDAMLASLDEEFADFPGVRWTNPDFWPVRVAHVPRSRRHQPQGPLVQAALEHGVLMAQVEFRRRGRAGECAAKRDPPLLCDFIDGSNRGRSSSHLARGMQRDGGNRWRSAES